MSSPISRKDVSDSSLLRLNNMYLSADADRGVVQIEGMTDSAPIVQLPAFTPDGVNAIGIENAAGKRRTHRFDLGILSNAISYQELPSIYETRNLEYMRYLFAGCKDGLATTSWNPRWHPSTNNLEKIDALEQKRTKSTSSGMLQERLTPWQPSSLQAFCTLGALCRKDP